MVGLTFSVIALEKIMADVVHPAAGGIDIFVGTTRNISQGKGVVLLEYEAYEPMAIRMMENLEKEAKERWPLLNVVLIHRLGRVPVGEASVVVAVSSPHRKEAFEACRFLIDTLKRDVPIWKREHFEDGTVEWSGQSWKTVNSEG